MRVQIRRRRMRRLILLCTVCYSVIHVSGFHCVIEVKPVEFIFQNRPVFGSEKKNVFVWRLYDPVNPTGSCRVA